MRPQQNITREFGHQTDHSQFPAPIGWGLWAAVQFFRPNSFYRSPHLSWCLEPVERVLSLEPEERTFAWVLPKVNSLVCVIVVILIYIKPTGAGWRFWSVVFAKNWGLTIPRSSARQNTSQGCKRRSQICLHGGGGTDRGGTQYVWFDTTSNFLKRHLRLSPTWLFLEKLSGQNYQCVHLWARHSLSPSDMNYGLLQTCVYPQGRHSN